MTAHLFLRAKTYTIWRHALRNLFNHLDVSACNPIATETGCKVVEWIQLTQDRVQWRDLVNTDSINGREFTEQLIHC